MRRLLARRPWLRDAAALLVLLGMCVAFVAVLVHKHDNISQVDEYVYIDYVAKFPTQGVVVRGEFTGTFAREYTTCHGVRGIPPAGPTCAESLTAPDAAFPNGGHTGADIYTPLYPGLTWIAAQPLVATGIDLVTAARLTGALWLAGFAALSFLAMRRIGVPILVAFGVTSLIAFCLRSEYAHTYISTDASALVVGAALVFLLTVRFRDRWVAAAALAGVATIGVLLKVQNVGAAVVVAVLLLARATLRVRRRMARGEPFARSVIRDRDLPAVLLVGAIPVVAQLGWMAIRTAIALGPSPDQGVAVPFTATALISETTKFLPNLLGQPGPTDHAIVGVIAAASSALLVGGLIGAIFAFRPGAPQSLLASATTVAAVTVPPLLAVLVLVGAGFYFPLPTRYGLSLAPFAGAVLALLVSRRRWSGPVAAVLGVGVFVGMCLFSYPG